jgi:formylglycine-generating enzyme required for sulfatase activity
MWVNRIALAALAASALGCAKGRTPPAITNLIAVGTSGTPLEAEFGEEMLCAGGKAEPAATASVCDTAKPPRSVPAMTVRVKPFQIDAHEVTNFQYQHCVATGDCTEPRAAILQLADGTQVRYYDEDSSDFADYPVVNVTWSQANDYCRSIGKRLPTDIEWELAARQNSKSEAYPWSDDPGDCKNKKVAIKACNESFGRLPQPAELVMTDDAVAIGAFTLWGMAGNVTEWTADPYDEGLTCAGSIEEKKTSTGGNCKNAYETDCKDKPAKDFKVCASPFELCQDCRDETDTNASISDTCYGQCTGTSAAFWMCQRHTEVVVDPVASGDESKRSVRGGAYTTADLCQARFSSRIDRSLDATKFAADLGFRCAKNL